MTDGRLTEEDFWNQYWSGLKLPALPDTKHSFDRCLAEGLGLALDGHKGRLLEIGCAPGKWMAHAALNLGFAVSGIEYSRGGIEATRRNLSLLAVDMHELHEGDFFSIPPEPCYNVVISLGFVEHFDDPAAVIERHALWLKPGGRLVIGVPNFLGIYRYIQTILDPGLLEKHNLAIMTPEWLLNAASGANMHAAQSLYLGSFEPDLPVPSQRPWTLTQSAVIGLLKVARTLRKSALLRMVDHLNHRWISSYILASYDKSGI